MKWYTSDLHFGHDKVLEYTKRPFASLDEMHEGLVSRWNSKIRDSDTVFIVGDLALCPFNEFVPICSRLNGIKKLIKGNHDHYSNGQYESLGIEVYDEIKMHIAGKVVRLSHYPYWLPWWKRINAFKSELRFKELRPPRIEGEFLMHGHTHTKYKKRSNRLHVGVDAWDCYPVKESQIESLMSKDIDVG